MSNINMFSAKAKMYRCFPKCSHILFPYKFWSLLDTYNPEINLIFHLILSEIGEGESQVINISIDRIDNILNLCNSTPCLIAFVWNLWIYETVIQEKDFILEDLHLYNLRYFLYLEFTRKNLNINYCLLYRVLVLLGFICIVSDRVLFGV